MNAHVKWMANLLWLRDAVATVRMELEIKGSSSSGPLAPFIVMSIRRWTTRVESNGRFVCVCDLQCVLVCYLVALRNNSSGFPVLVREWSAKAVVIVAGPLVCCWKCTSEANYPRRLDASQIAAAPSQGELEASAFDATPNWRWIPSSRLLLFQLRAHFELFPCSNGKSTKFELDRERGKVQ